MDIQYHVNETVEATEAVDLIRRSNVNRREDDARRLVRIVPEANIVVTARCDGKLVGLVRGLKELSGCCYVSDLIVDRNFTQEAVGEQLIRHVHDAIGENTLIVLVPAPDVVAYNTEID